MIRKKFYYLITLTIVLLSCSTTKSTDLGFTEFYKVNMICQPNHEKFSLNDKKLSELKITNNGTRKLYIPEWFDMSSGKSSELFITLYKKTDEGYELYKQQNKIVETMRQSNTFKREVLSTKNGNTICYSDIELDSSLKIVDAGNYLAEISVDLSNFGYFKKLTTSVFFEVVE